MKLSYIKSILLAAVLCALSNLYPGSWFSGDLEKADQILDAKITRLEKIAANLHGTSESFAAKVGTSLGNNLVTSIGTGKQAATEVFTDGMEKLTAFSSQFKQEVKQDQIDFLHSVINHVRLVPGYAAGTACLVGSIAMYWQALNDYLNNTDDSPEVQEDLHKKLVGKAKVGTGFLILGVFTLRFNRQIAHTFLGYEYPAVLPKAEEVDVSINPADLRIKV